MPTPRDDFPANVKQVLQNRVASRCSNPSCRVVTAGPQVDPGKQLNIGVAAHITAASPDGPRYDSSLTAQQRANILNGIWLCQNCAKLVDNDPIEFSVQLLHTWKMQADESALAEIGKPVTAAPQVIVSRPVLVLQYEANFEEKPETPFTINNVSSSPALEVQISSVVYKEEVAQFELAPVIPANSLREVLPELPHKGLFFRWRIRPLLDRAFHETRWIPSLNLSKKEIERLFDQPIVFPLTLEYRGATGEKYVEQFELVYIFFAASAFVRFPLKSTAA